MSIGRRRQRRIIVISGWIALCMIVYIIIWNDNNGFRSTVTKQETPADFRPLKWYYVPKNATVTDKWQLAVLSAFYDHRIDTVVILIASDAAHLLRQSNSSPPFTFICQLFYYKDSEPVEVDAYFYTSYLLYCPLPNSSQIPCKLSIKQNDSVDSMNCVTSWTIPVVNLLKRKMKTKPKKLAMCAGLLYGYQNWLMLLQYIEFHRMQGVDKLIFFYYDLHWSTIRILKWYKIHTNFVEVIKWNPNHFICGPKVRCLLLRINFCSYSLMYKYRFVANTDFDELLFPVNGSLIDLLDRHDRDDIGSFNFRAKYHQLLKNDIPEWSELTYDNISYAVKKYIPLYHFNNVSTMAGQDYSPKAIAKPETVLKRWVHYIRTHVEGIKTYHFKENEGVLRHFKIREKWGSWADQADLFVKYSVVNPKEEFGKNLLRNLTQRVTEISKDIKLFSYDYPNLELD